MHNERTRFLILFSGRSGGTLLHKSLNNHPNVFCEGELLHYLPSFDEQVQTLEQQVFAKLGGQVLAAGMKTKMVAFDESDYPRLLDYVNSNQIKVLHLYRDNPVKHALSHYVAQELYARKKVFEIYDDNDRITPIEVRFEEFYPHLLYVMEFERRLFAWTEQVEQLGRICYEHLSANPESVLAECQQWLGLPQHAWLQEPMRKVVPDDLREAVRNYDEFAERMNGILGDYALTKKAPFAGFCSEPATADA